MVQAERLSDYVYYLMEKKQHGRRSISTSLIAAKDPKLLRYTKVLTSYQIDFEPLEHFRF